MAKEPITKEEFLKFCDVAADMVMLAKEYAYDNEFDAAMALAENAALNLNSACNKTIQGAQRPKLAAVKHDA